MSTSLAIIGTIAAVIAAVASTWLLIEQLRQWKIQEAHTRLWAKLVVWHTDDPAKWSNAQLEVFNQGPDEVWVCGVDGVQPNTLKLAWASIGDEFVYGDVINVDAVVQSATTAGKGKAVLNFFLSASPPLQAGQTVTVRLRMAEFTPVTRHWSFNISRRVS